MSAAQVLLTVSFTVTYCCHKGCGIAIAIPDGVYQSLTGKNRGTHFYCLHGHEQWFTGESEAEKLKRQLEMAEQRVQTERKRVEAEQERSRRANLSANAFKGQVTRLRNRVGNGVCPCCNRTFQNLQRHMHTKHPEYAGSEPKEAD
jgi:hypothetical protein